MMEGTAAALNEMLGPAVDISSATLETNRHKLDALAFELYKETTRVLNLGAHILDRDASASGGLPRNQAICAGLMVRMTKFMIALMQLTCSDNRSEVALSLTRSIMESAFNLEFLVCANDDRHFDQFVKFSLGPERELYDRIQANIAKRNGDVLPIEKRMLASIDDLCEVSGVEISDVNPKHGNWGGGLKQRLEFLNKEEQYLYMHRLPSHAVHGTWVDLYKQHLKYDAKGKVFSPDPDWGPTDARAYGPTAVLVLNAVQPYVKKFFSAIPETELLLTRIDDLRDRIFAVDSAHEALMGRKQP